MIPYFVILFKANGRLEPSHKDIVLNFTLSCFSFKPVTQFGPQCTTKHCGGVC